MNDPSAALTVAPDPDAVPYKNVGNAPIGSPTVYIREQQADKTVSAVWLNGVLNPAGCLSPVWVDLRIYRYVDRWSGVEKRPRASVCFVTRSYDATGRLKKQELRASNGSVITNFAPPITYTYDPDGFVIKTTSAVDTVDLEWDSLGRMTKRTRADGAITKLNYGVGGDLESIDYPDGLQKTAGGPLQRHVFGQVKYEYNAAGDISKVKDFANREFTFEYDANGNLSKANYPVGARTLARDRVGRVTSITSPFPTRNYTYSAAGVPATGAFGSVAIKALSVDGALHLTQFGGGTNTFDLAENPTKIPSSGANSATQTFDAAGRIQSRTSTNGSQPPTTRTFSFDSTGFGRRTGESGGTQPSQTYQYDGYGRLRSYIGALRSDPSIPFIQTIVHSSDGTRRSTTKSIGTTVGATAYESWEDSLGDNASLLTQGLEAYIYGPGGMALERVKATGAPSYLWQDSLGSVIGTTDEAGAFDGFYNYDGWGRRVLTPSGDIVALAFAGEVSDPDTDLQYLRARYYDPYTAQFLTRDPQEATTGQPYLYAAGNPTMFTDPSGESVVDRVAGTFDTLTLGGTARARRALNGGCDLQDRSSSDYQFARTIIKVTAAVEATVATAGSGAIGGVAYASRPTVLVIGRTKTLEAGGLKMNEFTLLGKLSPKLPTTRMNVERNLRELRIAMQKVKKIRDADPLDDAGQWLNMEREALKARGWTRGPDNFWRPPKR